MVGRAVGTMAAGFVRFTAWQRLWQAALDRTQSRAGTLVGTQLVEDGVEKAELGLTICLEWLEEANP
jgi:hypothetical protein